MLYGFKVEVDVISPKFVAHVLNDHGLVPIDIYSNSGFEIYSFGVRKEAIK